MYPKNSVVAKIVFGKVSQSLNVVVFKEIDTDKERMHNHYTGKRNEK